MQNNHLSSKSSSIKQEIKRGPAIHYMPYLHQHTGMSWQLRLAARLAAAALTLSIWLPALAANQIDIVGPSGSGSFGSSITVLTNGNFVVTEPNYDIPGGATDVGAVYLYDGATHVLISTLTGSTSGDRVGNLGVTALSNGNYVVESPDWDNGSAIDAGAVTWGNGSTGVSGEVSSSNSLVGSTSGDQVGRFSIYYYSLTVLSNGNYIVRSLFWDNGSATDAGAVTWGDGSTGVSGEVSSSNSLIGSTSNDLIGGDYYGGITALSNGNYIVSSFRWDNGSAIDAGAATWGNGSTGVRGEISNNNSLVGSTNGDMVGYIVIDLKNDNYVTSSPWWDNGSAIDAGALTWINGSIEVSGVVSSSNSLVGSTSGDLVGYGGYTSGLTVLSNGNFVVRSSYWDNGSAIDAGAVTWINGSTEISGEVSRHNSLVGSTSGDLIGSGGLAVLSNNNYLVSSPSWDNGSATDTGAVTWGDGGTGIRGEVSSSNSLIGNTSDDYVGFTMINLPNGNYLVNSPYWDNGSAIDAGAVTWGNGITGVSGEVNSSNSLVGSTSYDMIGTNNWNGVVVLSNGNYVVHSSAWDNGSAKNAGAVTWGDSNTGVSGEISSSNSLVGSTSDDGVGYVVFGLNNGNYIVRSPAWNNGSTIDAGAVTWGSGTSGVSGEVNSSNSLVGSRNGDGIGAMVTVLNNGNYVSHSPYWDNGSATDVGAVTWGNGISGTTGEVSSSNSLIGTTNDDQVGFYIDVLSNGNYVVRSPFWDNSSASDVGAVTWRNGNIGASGEVSSSNSLVGTTSGDQVGYDRTVYNYGVIELSNGNYVVSSPTWDNGSATDAGAVTWASGTEGVSGEVSVLNSLVGSMSGDQVGNSGVTVLSNGNYVVASRLWDNSNATDAGAVSWGNGIIGANGIFTFNNSVLGTTAGGGSSMNFSYNVTYDQLIVGRPAENIVTIFDVSEQPIGNVRVYLPAISR